MKVPSYLGAWRRSGTAMVVAATVVAATVASLPQAASAQATSGLREAEVRYAAALTTGDIETALTFFDQAGVLTLSGCPESRDRAAVRSFLAGWTRSGQIVALTPEDLTQSGPDTAREVGAFRLTEPKAAATSHQGRYATTWAKVGSDWRIKMTVWLPDDPQGSAACAR